ncbi:MAG TPA: aminopeptidase P N-terminal domain-containing protein, partial [Chitinophagaceae bacterium]|nr:aminopeptidase P N-terminal domain-containing protein [Chitinophagaceae bacterium]
MSTLFFAKTNIVVIALLFTSICSAQPSPAPTDDLPRDYLGKDFHAGRREALRAGMPANSVAVVFSYPVRNFSNDVDYFFHQNPDMYYFSGYKEPHSMLLIFKEEQVDADGNKFNEVLFVQKRNPMAEQWNGRRLGTEGAREKLGFKTVYNADFPIDFSKFDKILFEGLPDDVSDNRYDKADLFDLLQHFRRKAGLNSETAKNKMFDSRSYLQLTASLREIKTPEEMDLIRKAVE